MSCGGKHYHIKDPAIVHGRVELLNDDGALIRVHARKTAKTPDILLAQQSDYLEAWADHLVEQKDGRAKAFLRKIMSPEAVTRASKVLNNLRRKRNVYQWRKNSRLSNRKFYMPVSRWDCPTTVAFDG